MLYCPLNFWRITETPAIIDSIKIKEKDVILDLGSPKFSAFHLASTKKCTIFATDIFNYFVGNSKLFCKALNIEKNYF